MMALSTAEGEERWNREIVPRVFVVVSGRLAQATVCRLLLVSPWCYRALLSHRPLWEVLDFRETNDAGNRLFAALALPRYKHIKHINLEFAQDIEDKHLALLKGKLLEDLQCLNLNGCQKISDDGVEAITSVCPKLQAFFIYWNMRVTDVGIKYLTNNCKEIVDLNLSGCKNVTDKSLQLIANTYQEMKALNLTRCTKITDQGLQQISLKCSSLESLNLYALSSLTDRAYKKFALLSQLRCLDLCGAQNLSDEGLCSIAECRGLVSLNLTWCVRITDIGVLTLARSCTSLEFLSVFGVLGVTDLSLEALSKSCSCTLTTLDVNGCVGIKRRSKEELLQLFPNLRCFKVHS
ncbi:F-box protein At3g58530 [Nymphaea colorata]|nr:F-box protein At3g58530 [Nymphaea colorata]